MVKFVYHVTQVKFTIQIQKCVNVVQDRSGTGIAVQKYLNALMEGNGMFIHILVNVLWDRNGMELIVEEYRYVIMEKC